VRHGQSLYQALGAEAGEDPPLSPLGIVQAHRLGEYLARYQRVDRILSSPLRRAYQTATIAAEYLGLPVAVDEALREFEDRFTMSPPLPRSALDPRGAVAATPERLRFIERVSGALRRLLADPERDETILVAAHGGTVSAILSLLLGMPTARIWSANTAIHNLRWTGEFWVIRYLNRQDHLPRPLRSW
jgi:broad specificity phosphatase PhoE